MTILTVEHLSKAFGDRVVLEDVSFSLSEGQRVGLLGVNGAGKSTLMRIVAGAEEADEGRIACRRGLAVGYLPQEPVFPAGASVLSVLEGAVAGHRETLARIEDVDRRLAELQGGSGETERLLEERSLLEEALERCGGWEIGHRIEALSQALSLADGASPVAQLSGGERRRLALAEVLLKQPELLLLDEPTNHLDTETISWLEQTLSSWRGTYVLVTHDRYFLERLVDEIVEVDRRELVRYKGNYGDYLAQRAQRLDTEERSRANRDSLLKRELAWMRRGPKARTHKQKARQQRFEALVADVPEGPPSELALRIPDGPKPSKRILELTDLKKAYGDRVLIRDLTLKTKLGDRIGIVGPNGVGKTTLLRLILGEEEPDSGTIEIGARTQIVHASQSRVELNPLATVYQSVAENREHVYVDGHPMHVRGYLTRFLFPSSLQETRVDRLSGGERNRLQLARLLRDGGNVILLDEPTNDLDLATLRALEEALLAFRGVVFVVSHDRYLLNRVATSILAFEEGGRVTRYDGDYDFYASRRRERLAAEEAERQRARQAEIEVERRSKPRAAASGSRKLSYKERVELEGMEARILELEARVEELQAQLEAPELYRSRAEEVPTIVAALKEAEGSVERLYERWAELESLAE